MTREMCVAAVAEELLELEWCCGMVLWWAGIVNYGPRHEADILILVLWVGLESYEWNG